MQKNHAKHSSNHRINHQHKGDDSIFHWLPEPKETPLFTAKEPVLISRQLVKKKYFETFNFYFSKPINEILANLSLSHVVLYKDYLYYDDDNEYLKRYYRLEETYPRIHNLSKYYSNSTEGLSRPNLAIHEQNKIILKRNNKLHKYFVSKLQNFADIPQTQRNRNHEDDFKILNNLHDEDGYSEDIYRHREIERKKQEEAHLKYKDMEGHLEVHNSFQQMLEKYEEATGKVSFESRQHNVYEPDESSDSHHKPQNKSTEENISFEKSLELSTKQKDKRFGLFEKPIFMATKSFKKAEERPSSAHGDTEDRIPHNMSDFGLSDTSEINMINEMMKGSVEDRLTDKIPSNTNIKAPEQHKEKAAEQKQKGETEKETETYKIASIQKANSYKSKSTSVNNVVNNSKLQLQQQQQQQQQQQPSETGVKKTRNIEKAKSMKEPDSAPIKAYQEATLAERIMKPAERYISLKDPPLGGFGIQGFASIKSDKEDLNIEKGHASARYGAELSPRDLQYPVISIKNIHINQIKPAENGKDSGEGKAPIIPFDDKNFLNKTRKSTPHTGKKNFGFYKKLSMPGETKITTEKHSTNSIQYIKGLIEKYQKSPDETLTSRSKAAFEKRKDVSIGSKSKVNYDDITDKYQKMEEIYANTDLYAKVAKKTDPKMHMSRSKTEDALLKDLVQNKQARVLKESPTKMMDNQPSSARRLVLSPTTTRKEKIMYRFGSNEGLSPKLFASTTNKLSTQLSLENSKSLGENIVGEEKNYNSGGSNFKSVKVEKIFAYKRTEMKPPMKTNTPKTEVSHSSGSNTRRLTAAHTYSGASSVEKNDLLSNMPTSPPKKMDLKLNLNKLNNIPGRFHHEIAPENSYGFWTSRSTKIAFNEESGQKQSAGLGDDKQDSNKKEYLLKKNYEPYLDIKKKGKQIKKGGSFTNVASAQGFKLRESETSRNPTLLKSNDTDMHQIYIQDLNEVNSAGKVPHHRNGEARIDFKQSKK